MKETYFDSSILLEKKRLSLIILCCGHLTMFLKIYEKYRKLFLSILYLTEMENITYGIKDIVPTSLSSLYFNSEI